MDRQRLIERICQTALKRGKFTLRSGQTSNYYLDKYLFETQPDILEALGKLFAERVGPAVTRLAGPELGGVPLVTAASLVTRLPTVLIRNQKKDYGTAKQIEGVLEPGDRVMIIEDIATTGGQTIEAAAALGQAGAEIDKIVVVVDREQGARQNIESAGYVFESLFTKSDLGIDE